MIKFLSPANGAPRLSPSEYIQLCLAHFKRNWKGYCIPVAVVVVLQFFFRLDVNYTESLPDNVFLTVKGWKTGLKHGDYVAYKFPTENPTSPFRKGDHMVKRIGGVAGDEVRMDEDRSFTIVSPGESEAHRKLIGARPMGTAKTHSRTGKPLEAGPVGVIPEGSYYMFAPHKDSLDSRYAMVGWITEKDIIGRTFSLF